MTAWSEWAAQCKAAPRKARNIVGLRFAAPSMKPGMCPNVQGNDYCIFKLPHSYEGTILPRVLGLSRGSPMDSQWNNWGTEKQAANDKSARL